MEADESAGIIMKNRTERIIEEENKMKTIGLLGGLHSAKILLCTFVNDVRPRD